MEKIDLNGHVVRAEVLERDSNGDPQRIRYEGAELIKQVHHSEFGPKPRWLMTIELSPLEAAHALLKEDYKADVRLIADDVRERVKSGELDTRRGIERFIHESCDGSSRLQNTANQRSVLTYTDNIEAAQEAGSDLAYAAFLAFQADVYEELGDIDELLQPDEEDEDDEDDTA